MGSPERSMQDIPFSTGASRVLEIARAYGNLPPEGRGTDEVAHAGTEHLLLALTTSSDIQAILAATRIPFDPLVADLVDYINTDPNHPTTDEQGQTDTFVSSLNNALRLAEEYGEVTPVHLYAGMIESGRGKALMTLGRFLGFSEEDREATPFIQDALFEHIPSMRRE
ncbi:MAG: hypothetical protein HYV40_06825 [Candidatus Levybacteria bacterium]|nr:hypothetical protein [Candidatus Levybacteria bacterium]